MSRCSPLSRSVGKMFVSRGHFLFDPYRLGKLSRSVAYLRCTISYGRASFAFKGTLIRAFFHATRRVRAAVRTYRIPKPFVVFLASLSRLPHEHFQVPPYLLYLQNTDVRAFRSVPFIYLYFCNGVKRFFCRRMHVRTLRCTVL